MGANYKNPPIHHFKLTFLLAKFLKGILDFDTHYCEL